MKIILNKENDDAVMVAMEVGYQAISDLVTLYQEINRELLKQLAIFEGKSVKEIKKEVNKSLYIGNIEEELLSKIKASKEMILRFNATFGEEENNEQG